MRVHDVRREDLRGCDRGGSAKENKAAHVVGIIDSIRAVDSAAAEKSRMVDQIHRHAMRIGAMQHRKAFDGGAESHRDIAQDRRGLDAFQQGSVAGHD